MGRPKPWRQKHPYSRRRFNRRSGISRSDAECWNPSCFYSPNPAPSVAPSVETVKRGTGRFRNSVRFKRRSVACGQPSEIRIGQGSRIRPKGPTTYPRRSYAALVTKIIFASLPVSRAPLWPAALRGSPSSLHAAARTWPRVSDEFTVPLCRVHHRELHRQGNERAWWNKANIDPDADCPQILAAHARCAPGAGNNQKPEKPAAHQGGASAEPTPQLAPVLGTHPSALSASSAKRASNT